MGVAYLQVEALQALEASLVHGLGQLRELVVLQVELLVGVRVRAGVGVGVRVRVRVRVRVAPSVRASCRR